MDTNGKPMDDEREFDVFLGRAAADSLRRSESDAQWWGRIRRLRDILHAMLPPAQVQDSRSVGSLVADASQLRGGPATFHCSRCNCQVPMSHDCPWGGPAHL